MWYYKGDLRYGDDKDEGWKPYEDEEYVSLGHYFWTIHRFFSKVCEPFFVPDRQTLFLRSFLIVLVRSRSFGRFLFLNLFLINHKLTSRRNEKLERAYKNKKPIVKLNNKYKADLDKMFQYRIKDTTKQRKIKRVEVDSSDEDEPPKKKKKLSPPAIAGQEVCLQSPTFFGAFQL